MNNADSQTPEEMAEQRLDKFRAEDGHGNPPGYRYYLKRLFGTVDLRGKRVLEVGSGRGLISLHCGLSGASRVVSIEPEMEGSTSGVIETQRRRIDELGLDNVELRRADFNDFNFGAEKFDVIVMVAVLNHLYETPFNASKDHQVFNKYVKIAKQLYSLLNPRGVVIATDACRYCLWTLLRRVGLPKQYCLSHRTINWKIHQQPSVWRSIFLEAGFHSCDINYPVPHRARGLRPILNTSLTNFALMGEFILHGHRGGGQ